MAIPLESLKGMNMISSDAYEIGEINDICYDPFEWNVVGLRVKIKRSSEKLSAGFGKTTVLVLPDKFIMNDVMLLSRPIDGVKGSVVPDNKNISSLLPLVSAKVVTRDNALIGNVVTVMIDPDSWKVPSIVVRLDKGAIEAMGMKKGLFSKINVEIGTEMILSSADLIHLNEQMDGVRNKMTVVE